MEALIETTGGQFPAHTYLLEGTTLVAYIKVGTKEPFYFKNGIKNFDKRGRQFQKTAANAFKTPKKTTVINNPLLKRSLIAPSSQANHPKMIAESITTVLITEVNSSTLYLAVPYSRDLAYSSGL